MKVLVTGGAGFLGSHIVELLLCLSADKPFADVKVATPYDDEDEVIATLQHKMLLPVFKSCEVVVFDLSAEVLDSDEYTQELFKEATFIKGDITDYDTVLAAVKGCEAVIHTASVIDYGNIPKDLVLNVNINGTKNIIRACKECNVKALVYSSSIEVLQVREGVKGLDDDIPYALDLGRPFYKSTYMVSKTAAEKEVLLANGSKTENGCKLAVGIVRPSGMYGERDRTHIRLTLNASRDAGSGNFVRIGDGTSLFQHVYVGNVAHMHLCVLNKLLKDDETVCGQAFMGIDFTKVNNFFDFFEPYIADKGYKVPTVRVPIAFMYRLACLAEFVKTVLDFFFPAMRKINNVLTRQSVLALDTDIWFKTDKAKRLTGYVPIVSPMRARSLSIAHFAKRTTEFPQGPFKYARGQYDYEDSGQDYLPDMKLVESRRQSMKRNLLYLYAFMLILFSIFLYRSGIF